MVPNVSEAVIKDLPDLVKDLAVTVNVDLVTKVLLDRSLDLRKGVGSSEGGHDTVGREPVVSRESLVGSHRFLEVDDDILLGLVVVEAFGLERGNTCSVLVKLVLPETLVVALVILPVRVHVRQHVGLACRLENLGNVGVLPRRVAELLVRAITVIGPQAVQRPRSVGAGRSGSRVPELREEEMTTRRVGAACVLSRGARAREGERGDGLGRADSETSAGRHGRGRGARLGRRGGVRGASARRARSGSVGASGKVESKRYSVAAAGVHCLADTVGGNLVGGEGGGTGV